MPMSPDVRDTVLAAMTASLAAALLDVVALSVKDPSEPEAVSLVVEAWHHALLRYHSESLARTNQTAIQERTMSVEDEDLVVGLADSLQANQAADYLALCIVNRNRARIGWPPLDPEAAQSLRKARREQWAHELAAAYGAKREELAVLRLSYEQRDAVRESFWSGVFSQLRQRLS